MVMVMVMVALSWLELLLLLLLLLSGVTDGGDGGRGEERVLVKHMRLYDGMVVVLFMWWRQ